MIFTIIIILIVALIIVAIAVNAVQQHREKMESEKRAELAKQKAVVDETENVLLAVAQIPVSKRLVFILNQRIRNALVAMMELSPSGDLKSRINDITNTMEGINQNEPPPSHDGFELPENDRLVIQFIQAIKKFRILLRSEHSKGKIDGATFLDEDKQLERLQLRVNVETLGKRGAAAVQGNMLGSARQYFEKALAAIDAQSQPDEYMTRRRADLAKQLQVIQDNLRNANAADREKKKEEERDELDELFAPKKKW